MKSQPQLLKKSPQRQLSNLLQFASKMFWIILGAFILMLIITRSDSGIPLLLGVIVAIILYKITRKLAFGKSKPIRVTLWILMALGAYFAYVTIWWQWGAVQVELLRYLLEQPDKEFQRLLAKDTYGSKTSPQETYQMYLDALRKGDIDLAVKYFVPGNDQKNRKEFFERLKALGSFEKWVGALGDWSTCKEVKAKDWMGGIRKSYECAFTVSEPINMGESIFGGERIIQPGSWTSVEDFVFIESSGLWKLTVNY